MNQALDQYIKNINSDTIGSPDIPDHTRQALMNYFDHALPPGSFCSALLSNDLRAAVHKADFINKDYIFRIVKWIEYNAPQDSWGDWERIEGWLSKNQAYENYQRQRVIGILKK